MYLSRHWKIKKQIKCSSYKKGDRKGKQGENSQNCTAVDRSAKVGLIVLILKITENRLNPIILKNDNNKDFSFQHKT